MKILCLADLHYRKSWFEWTIAQSLLYDLTCIAGDLLYNPALFGGRSAALPDWAGGGHTPSLKSQTYQVRELFTQAEHNRRLGCIAVSSGNHDPLFLWNKETGLGDLSRDFVTLNDGCCDALAGWSVSCLSYDLRGDAFRQRWSDDHTKAAAQARRWIVLCHVGPAGSRVMGGAREEQPMRELIQSQPPAVLLCGHIHRAPFNAQDAWNDRIGPTLVLNPGSQDYRAPSAAFPPHLVINTETQLVTWNHAESTPPQPQATTLN